MPITQLTQNVSLSGLTNYYLNQPVNQGMNDGYWYYYSSSVANNTLGTRIKPYRWGTELTTNEVGNFLTMDGTIQLVSESLNRPRVFHGSGIIRDGGGLSPQLGITLTDSFFFYHLGDLRATDNIGYWDYAYLQDGSSDWTYFQYHQHNPNIYSNVYNARNIIYGNQWLNETDKSFGHIQSTTVTVMGTDYTNIMARVHTPSAGFAHNSHFDQELPATKTANYMMGGILKGTSDKYHAFYISANGSQWNVFSRTFILSSAAWSAEVNHGVFDLADPNLTQTVPGGDNSNFPFRASNGALVGAYCHVPVIYNNPTTGFDLKIWQFESNNSVLTNTITTQSIVTGVTQRPDCHLTTVGTTIYALISDTTNGGIDLYKHLDNTTSWSFVDSIINNGTNDVIRIHGFDYNTADTKFYTLLSGDRTGSVAGANFSGSGVYSFSEGITFEGYSHLSYMTSSYGFQVKPALGQGYIKYTNLDGSLVFNDTTEPAGIAEDERILIYNEASPKFFDKTDTKLGGNEFYYAGTKLSDGRLVGVGVIDENIENRGGYDLVLAIYDGSGEHPEFFGTGGSGDDYYTGVIEDTDNKFLWTIGYTKSYLAQKRDIKVHGFGRGLIDGGNRLEWKDMSVDSEGNQYFAGNHLEHSGSLVGKYDYNFNLLWINEFSSSLITTAYGITLDSSNNSYVVGHTNDGGAGGYDSYVTKFDVTGSILWSKYFGTAADETGSAIAKITKSSTDYIVTSIVSGSATIINILNTSGSIVEQNVITGFTVNRVRESETEGNGYFLLAGKDNSSPSKAKIAKGQVLTSSGNMVKWMRTLSSGSLTGEAFDIRNTEQSTGAGGLGSQTGPRYHVVGSEGTNGFIVKMIMDESAGSFQSTKVWGTNTSGSVLTALTNTPYTVTPSGSRYTYVTGYSNVSPEGEGGYEGIISSFDYTGSRVWTNTLGHTNDEKLFAIERDVTNENLLVAGWSESHTSGRRTFNFRGVNTGFGTGNHHEVASVGMAMWYQSSSLSTLTNSATFADITSLSNISITLTATSGSLNSAPQPYSQEFYDGGNIFDFFICKVSLDEISKYKNTDEHKLLDEECDNVLKYNDDLFTFYQVGSAGDGTADDGNFFGYDIIRKASTNEIFAVGQTSANIFKNNLGSSGVYDYVLVEFDELTETFEFYQNGTSFDEEIYSLNELSDGRISFVGRTTGNIGGNFPQGTYDILLGIYNPTGETFNYYQTGSSNIDKAVNAHDVGNGEIAIVFETAGTITTGATTFGGLDIGVMLFNYTANTWSTSSYQIGSTEDEILSQEGKHSVYLPNSNRIAICGKTLGTFGDDNISYGVNDMFLAIFDLNSKTWTKYQIGTEGNETGTTVFSLGGDRLIVGGYSDASFEEPNNGIFVQFDASVGIKGKSS